MAGESAPDNLISLLKRVNLATRRALDDAFVAHGLTGPQVDLLRHVWLQNGIEQRVLQERLGVTSATLTGIVDGLVERELVERHLSADDARVKQLFLTERGQALSSELLRTGQGVEARLLEGFSVAEQALLRDWLRRMALNIGAPQNDGCA